MHNFVLALDQGTTSSRAIIFDHDGAIQSVAQQEFKQIFPQAGWVEHDPGEIWQTQLATARDALAKAGLCASDVAAVGITNAKLPLYGIAGPEFRSTTPSCGKTGAPPPSAMNSGGRARRT